MKSPISILTLGVLALVLGCSSVTIKHDYDKDANFAAYKTYAWLAVPTDAAGSVKAAMERNSLLDKRIKESVNRQLEAKGFTPDTNNPDVVLLYHTGAEDKINVTDWGYGYGHGGYGYGGWYGGGGVDVTQYREGTLILDFIDAKAKQLVWRGFATAALNPDAPMEKRERRLDEVITQILAKYPPPAK
ncbi:MAG: DUF4136 domain-containing protein [bacterium]